MSVLTPDLFDLSYRVRPAAPHRHVFSVEIHAKNLPDGPVELSLPAWIPGSYMIRDFARNLIEISAEDGAGVALPLEKRDKQTWVCQGASGQDGAGQLRVFYQVYAWELSVRAAHLDLTHAYFNGPSLLLRVAGLDEQPCQIELLPPHAPACKDWRIATSLRPLEAEPGGFGTYQAESYADLIDHPVEMGAFKRLCFAVDDIPHQVAISGHVWLDEARLIADLTKICAEHAALFGELPIDRYLFLVMVLGEGYGGLEHRYCTSLICSREDLPIPGEETASAQYNRFLGLCSHEYFHLWHVKRIRPQAFVDGGLDREIYTRLLWVFEGITSYYDELALVRSGCIDTATYLTMLAETITRVMRNPGRHVQTLAESSFDAWTKFYKQDENAPNAIVSYYAKGALVALALDLKIRHETAGACSLDALMCALWQRHGRTGTGLAEDGFAALAMEITGLDLTDFLARAVDSTEDLELEPLLQTVGIEMRLRSSQNAKDLGGCVECFDPVRTHPTLDLRLNPSSAEALVQSVISDGAGETAGIAPGDLIVAVDGLRATAENLERLVARAAGRDGTVVIHLFRRDELLTLTTHPRPARNDTCELMLTNVPSEPVARARAAWLASVA